MSLNRGVKTMMFVNMEFFRGQSNSQISEQQIKEKIFVLRQRICLLQLLFLSSLGMLYIVSPVI